MSRPLTLGLMAVAFTAPASADPVLDMMRALSTDGPVYAYEMVYSDTDITATGTIDPSQPEGQRVVVTSPDEAEWSDDFRDGLEEMDAEADGDIWCAEFAEMVPDDAVAASEDDATKIYTFTPEADPEAESREQKMMKQLDGTITVDKSDGAVLSFNMVLPKPYKPAMVAKINAFEMTATCARAPDGRTFVETFSLAIQGSAMMQSFEESVTRQITQLLDPVG